VTAPLARTDVTTPDPGTREVIAPLARTEEVMAPDAGTAVTTAPVPAGAPSKADFHMQMMLTRTSDGEAGQQRDGGNVNGDHVERMYVAVGSDEGKWLGSI
jgi:hypothetical protein